MSAIREAKLLKPIFIGQSVKKNTPKDDARVSKSIDYPCSILVVGHLCGSRNENTYKELSIIWLTRNTKFIITKDRQIEVDYLLNQEIHKY